MAHKLARLVYRMLKWGHEYVDKGLDYYEARHREQQVQLIRKRAARLVCKSSNPTRLDLSSKRFLERLMQVPYLVASSVV